jgi:HD-GYP domain-containing protein (c-di-GMP phosphodiesterase class II)
MITDRPYRAGLSIETTIGELRKGSGTQFDPEVVRVFLGCLEEQQSKSSGQDESAIRIGANLRVI